MANLLLARCRAWRIFMRMLTRLRRDIRPCRVFSGPLGADAVSWLLSEDETLSVVPAELAGVFEDPSEAERPLLKMGMDDLEDVIAMVVR